MVHALMRTHAYMHAHGASVAGPAGAAACVMLAYLTTLPTHCRNEAYQRCGSQVVALVKCVEEHPGPAWYWSCGQVYVALQVWLASFSASTVALRGFKAVLLL